MEDKIALFSNVPKFMARAIVSVEQNSRFGCTLFSFNSISAMSATIKKQRSRLPYHYKRRNAAAFDPSTCYFDKPDPSLTTNPLKETTPKECVHIKCLQLQAC